MFVVLGPVLFSYVFCMVAGLCYFIFSRRKDATLKDEKTLCEKTKKKKKKKKTNKKKKKKKKKQQKKTPPKRRQYQSFKLVASFRVAFFRRHNLK